MYGAILGDIYTGQEVMADDIRITKTEDGATLMVNITAIHEFIRQASIEGAMEILKSGIASYLEKEGDRPMEK